MSNPVIRLSTSPHQNRARSCVDRLLSEFPTGPFRNTIWIEECHGYAEISSFNGRLHIGGVFVLPDFRRPKEGRSNQEPGFGTRIMKMLMERADHAGLEMSLSPQPFGTDKSLNKTQLKRWYKTLGFKTAPYGDQMIRPIPNTSFLKDDHHV